VADEQALGASDEVDMPLLGVRWIIWSSLRKLCVLGGSAVDFLHESAHRRAAKHAEFTQRKAAECELAFFRQTPLGNKL
jgi:hypothetical protein